MTTEADQRWWDRKKVRAVTLYPWATMDVDSVLAELAERNVNTVMVICKESDGRVFYDSDVVPNQVPERDLLAEFVDAADRRDLRIVPVFHTLTDKFLLEGNPDYVQLARDGTAIKYPNVSFEWMHWVCPSHEAVRNHLRLLAEEVAEYDVDGVRFQHLEFQPISSGDTDYLSCFCDQCIDVNDDGSAGRDHDEWMEYRASLTTDLLGSLAAPFDDDQMVNLQFEVFANMEATFRDSYEQLGLDIDRASNHVDTLSPRTAHIDMDVHPLWIRDVTRSLREAVDCPIIPSIRTASSDDPDETISQGELLTAMQMALHGGADGLSLFSTGANIGRLTDEQWDVVEESFEGLASLEVR